MGQSSTSTDDVTVSCAPGCRVMPDQARLSAGLSGDVEKTMPFTLTLCRESEPVGAITSGVAGCSATKPPAGFARSVRGWESGDSRPDSRSVPSTLQTIEPVLLVVQAALSSMSESVGNAQWVPQRACRRKQSASARAGDTIVTILKTNVGGCSSRFEEKEPRQAGWSPYVSVRDRTLLSRGDGIGITPTGWVIPVRASERFLFLPVCQRT